MELRALECPNCGAGLGKVPAKCSYCGSYVYERPRPKETGLAFLNVEKLSREELQKSLVKEGYLSDLKESAPELYEELRGMWLVDEAPPREGGERVFKHRADRGAQPSAKQLRASGRAVSVVVVLGVLISVGGAALAAFIPYMASRAGGGSVEITPPAVTDITVPKKAAVKRAGGLKIREEPRLGSDMLLKVAYNDTLLVMDDKKRWVQTKLVITIRPFGVQQVEGWVQRKYLRVVEP